MKITFFSLSPPQFGLFEQTFSHFCARSFSDSETTKRHVELQMTNFMSRVECKHFWKYACTVDHLKGREQALPQPNVNSSQKLISNC
jgi:hypothetical protein